MAYSQNKPSNQSVKDRFDIAIENMADEYINSLRLDEFAENKLLNPQAKRAELLEKVKEEAKLPELSTYIGSAFKIIREQGDRYFHKEDLNGMVAEFTRANVIMSKIDLSKIAKNNFQEILNISNTTMQLIFDFAIKKYNELQFQDSASLFALLTTLLPDNADYWYKLGITAQKSENFRLAIAAYEITLSLNEDALGARVFAAECYHKIGAWHAAEEKCKEAKVYIETKQMEKSWSQLLTSVERLVRR